jgi:hypothetical protein
MLKEAVCRCSQHTATRREVISSIELMSLLALLLLLIFELMLLLALLLLIIIFERIPE